VCSLISLGIVVNKRLHCYLESAIFSVIVANYRGKKVYEIHQISGDSGGGRAEDHMA
jgi:hypothetical protein